MAYTTPEKVRGILKGFVEALSPQAKRQADELDDAQIKYAISNAEAQINATLRSRYNVPFADPAPDLIQVIATDIAAALADLTYRGATVYQSALHPMRLRYERANLLLSQVAGGSLSVYDVTEEAIEGLYHPYPGDVLLTTDVFPRGFNLVRGGEYSETDRIPYDPYLRRNP